MRKAKEERNRVEWGGGLELFNYSTHRQQRPRFQETITVCSPEGKAHLASFISSFPSPHKLQVGIFNAFLLLHKQTQASLSFQMCQMPRSATWRGKSSCWKITRKSALYFCITFQNELSQLIERVQTSVNSTDSDYSY